MFTKVPLLSRDAEIESVSFTLADPESLWV
jgi:hypothetical protein